MAKRTYRLRIGRRILFNRQLCLLLQIIAENLMKLRVIARSQSKGDTAEFFEKNLTGAELQALYEGVRRELNADHGRLQRSRKILTTPSLEIRLIGGGGTGDPHEFHLFVENRDERYAFHGDVSRQKLINMEMQLRRELKFAARETRTHM